MSYGLIYTIPFVNIDGAQCVVEIEKENYAGTSTELTASGEPFSVEIDDEEFIYTPLRMSTAKISIVGSDYLQSLFSTSYREYRVTLKRGGIVTWCGFVKPELYTQDYVSDNFVLEIDCISAMSVLEFIDYKKQGEELVFVSIWDLIKKCIDESRGQYTGVYIPHVYAAAQADYIAGVNVLAEMMISEQNFFDEEDKAMTLKDVLENICKVLNWTCADWRGDLFFVDMDHAATYHKYNIGLTSKVDEAVNELNVQEIGFSGSDHSLDILPGYNKVTVKDSNYSASSLTRSLDFENLAFMIKKTMYDQSNNRGLEKFYWPPTGVVSFSHYKLEMPDGETNIGPSYYIPVELTPVNVDLVYGGAPAKVDYYQLENGEPNITDYSFEDTIKLAIGKDTTVMVEQPDGSTAPETVFASLPSGIKLISIDFPTLSYKDCALAIQGNAKILGDSRMLWDYLTGESKLRCTLRIGENYWNGTEWTTVASYFDITFDGTSEWNAINNNKTLDMPYSGLTGTIIPITNLMYGKMNLTIMAHDNSRIYDMYLRDFKVVVQKADDVENESLSEDSSDRTYTNTVNEDYINELDEIEFKITSYNRDGACYSKLLLHGTLLETLWNSIINTEKRPEEMLITRIINHYSVTRTKLTQEIKERNDITPIIRLSDNYQVNKRFINVGGSIDYKKNSFSCKMIEI